MSDEPYRYDPATMRRQIVQDWLDALGITKESLIVATTSKQGNS